MNPCSLIVTYIRSLESTKYVQLNIRIFCKWTFCQSIYLSVCLSIGLFRPTSRLYASGQHSPAAEAQHILRSSTSTAAAEKVKKELFRMPERNACCTYACTVSTLLRSQPSCTHDVKTYSAAAAAAAAAAVVAVVVHLAQLNLKKKKYTKANRVACLA